MITVDLGTIQLNQIAGGFGTTGAWSVNSQPGCLYCGPDDDSCVYFGKYYPSAALANLYVIVVDISGAYTFYAPPYPALNAGAGNAYTISAIVPFGSGLFLVTLSGGQTFWITVANHKLNNATPIPIFPSSSSMAAPCNPGGVPSVSTFYDAISKRIINGYYYASVQTGSDVYSSCYSVNAQNATLTKLAGGYVGYSDPGAGVPDPFNLTSSGLTGWYNKYVNNCSNGLVIAGGLKNYSDKYDSIQTQGYSITPGNNVPCDGTKNGASVSSTDPYYVTSSLLPWGTAPDLCDFSVPYIAGVLADSGYLVMLGSSVLYKAAITVLNPYTGQPDALSNSSMAITKKNIFAVWNGNFALDHIAGVATDKVVNIGNALVQNAYSTVNSVRPISLTGAYKT